MAQQVFDQVPFSEHTANGVTTVFAFDFQVLEAADMVVYKNGVVVPSSEYTLSGLGVVAGGTVTFTVAPANGVTVLLSREIALERKTEYQTLGDFKAATMVNPDFNRVWQALQGQRAKLGGSIRAPYPQQLDELPDPAGFDGYYIGMIAGQPGFILPPSGTAGALAADLAAANNPAKGQALVGLNLTGSNEVSTTGHAYLNLKVKGLKRNFGATGDGVANDYTAVNNAFQATGKIIEIEEGTFLYNTNLTAPTCAGIVGRGELVSILKPGSGLTRGLTISGSTYPTTLRGFQLLGSTATTATGLYLGETASCAVQVDQVRIKSFSGSGGVGLRVGYLLKSTINMVTCEGNETGLLVRQAASNSLPTTLRFESCVFTNSSTYGARINDGTGLVFVNTDFETSTLEGLYVETASVSRDIIDLYVGEGCWFEDNNATGGSNSYHILVSSNTGSRTVRPIIHDCYFDIGTSGRAQRAVKLSGADIAGYLLDNLRLSIERSAETITVDTSAYGKIERWPPYLNYSANVNVASSAFDFGHRGKNRVETNPTGAPTVASANTISLADVPVTFISGTALIKTINRPPDMSAGGWVTLIPTGAWTWDATGNIAVGGTAVVSRALDLFYDATTGKWYPSYV